MGQMQRNKRIERERAGRCRRKVWTPKEAMRRFAAAARQSGAALRALAGAFAATTAAFATLGNVFAGISADTLDRISRLGGSNENG